MSRHWARLTRVQKTNEEWSVELKNTATGARAVVTFSDKDLGHNKRDDSYYTEVTEMRADQLAYEIEKTIERVTDSW